ncbi:MAG TPA: hypothetical protein VF171_05215 [Trueperaceae bacterium]
MIAAALFEPFALWLAARNDPALQDRPLVAAENNRVVHANTAARRAGVAPSMPLQGAKLRTPDLAVVPAKAPLLVDEWRGVLSELYGLTPWLESLGVGRVLLKIGPADAELLAASYRVRVGVATNRQTALLAALAAFEGKTRVVPEGSEKAFLDVLPVRFLAGIGLSAEALADLGWLNIRTVGRLARWSQPQITGLLGPEARALLPYLKGPWDDRVASYRPDVTVTAEYDFDEPAVEPYQYLPVIEHLAGQLQEDLQDRAARRLKVAVWLGGICFPATRLAKDPIRDAKTIGRLSLLALADTGASALGFERIELQLAALTRPADQGSLWQHVEREKAIRAVSERYPHALLRIELADPWSTALEERYRFVRLSDNQEVPRAPRPANHPRQAEPARAARVLASSP